MICPVLRLPLQNRQSVSLEPGGQFELSGAPLETVHQTCGEVSTHLEQVMTGKGEGGRAR